MLAQPLLAQRPTAAIDEISVASDRDGALLSQFRTSLRASSRGGGWVEGWQLSHDVGTIALPLLARMWREERNATGRFAVLGAIALASDGSKDRFLWSRLREASGTRERFVSLFCLTFGGGGGRGSLLQVRAEDRALLASLLRSSDTKPVVRVAGCLVARRIGLAPPTNCYGIDDAGVASAARFARARSEDSGLSRWVRGRGLEHSELVIRGALLGFERSAELPHLLRVRVDRGLAAALWDPTTIAAAIVAARTFDPATLYEPPRGVGDPYRASAWAAAILATDAGHRNYLADSLVRSLGTARPFPGQSERNAVALALVAPVDRLAVALAALPATARPGDLEQAFCLGLAYRLAMRPTDASVIRVLRLPDCSAATWVRHASRDRTQSGGRVGAVGPPDVTAPEPEGMAEVAQFGDACFHRAFAALRRGVLRRGAALRAVEDAMWRRGVHPMRTVEEAELLLARDLLLTGTEVGKALYQPAADPYFARGLPAGDPTYEIAARLLDFVSSMRARETPAARRLR